MTADEEDEMLEAGVSWGDISWAATWGDRVHEGDLIRVTKLGGPVRIRSLRKFIQPWDKRGGPEPEDADATQPWFYGAVVEDRTGSEYHLQIQPYEAVFVAVDVPTTVEIPEGDSGSDA